MMLQALFTSVPIDPALGTIKDLMEKDNTLKERTVLLVKDIVLLLEFCPKKHLLSFQGQFYEQVEGAAMGSLGSSIVAKLYMQYIQQKSTRYCSNPKLWFRYVDDTWVVQREENKQNFLQHINNVDPAIKFTVENNKEDGAILFFDTTVKQEANG